ncbi:hypothetical protein VCHENC02_0711, partial [Vibrio harveyi]
WKQR